MAESAVVGRPRLPDDQVSARALTRRKARAKKGKKPRRSAAIIAAGKLKRGQVLAAPVAREGALGADAAVLTLLQICQMAGLRYKPVMTYLKKHSIELVPNNGKKGRTRRYSVAAVKELERVFAERVKRGAPGREPRAEASSVMAALQSIARQIRDLRKELARPMRVRFER